MALDAETCYRALRAHDPRFDGIFFIGVTTTGIYCRPVCRARRPRSERCRYFSTAAAAEAQGFRPCLRCRPELAPGRAMTDATSRLAAAAAARIAGGGLNGRSVPQLAAELYVGERQLRRALRREYGVSPVALAQTHRLLMAKRLLTDSSLPMTTVASASGFSSVSRFNTLFRERYRLSPTALRRVRTTTPANDGRMTLTLAYRPPLAWHALLAFLAARATPGVELIENGRYVRTVSLGAHRGHVSVGPAGERRPELRVEVSLSLVPVLMPLLSGLKNLFDLDAEPVAIEGHLAADPLLGPLVRQHAGLRVPGGVSGFELAVRAVLGQQVSVRAASTLAGRIAAAFGEPTSSPLPGLTRYPATAERLADAHPERLAALGVTRARAVSIAALARAVADGEVRLDPGVEVDDAIERLQALPGIGAWTAQYIAMRALHWPDAFPHSDLGLRKALGGISHARVLAAAEPWRPWRAYAAMHLWHRPQPTAA